MPRSEEDRHRYAGLSHLSRDVASPTSFNSPKPRTDARHRPVRRVPPIPYCSPRVNGGRGGGCDASAGEPQLNAATKLFAARREGGRGIAVRGLGGIAIFKPVHSLTAKRETAPDAIRFVYDAGVETTHL